MNSPTIYRVRFLRSQRYAINISAPSAELAELFAEEIRKGPAPPAETTPVDPKPHGHSASPPPTEKTDA